MAISIIWDPQYKFQLVVLAYRKVYGDRHEIGLSLLKDKLFSVFGEYAKSSNGLYSATKKFGAPLKLLMWKKALIH